MKKNLFLILSAFLILICMSVFSYSQNNPGMKNPYANSPQAIKEGHELFKANCATCHGPEAKGDICPDLTRKNKKYGNADADLLLTITKGRPGGMPNWNNTLGTEKIWKIIAFLRSIEK